MLSQTVSIVFAVGFISILSGINARKVVLIRKPSSALTPIPLSGKETFEFIRLGCFRSKMLPATT